MACRGICERYKAKRILLPGGQGTYSPYKNGRRCTVCSMFIKWEGLHCPCCGYRLRVTRHQFARRARAEARGKA